jgi:inner membrane protein
VPSAFSHAVVGLSLGACFAPPGSRVRLLAVGAACAVLPDLDVAGLPYGFHLDHPLGHRGLSHSLPFAVVLAAALTLAIFPRGAGGLGRFGVWLFLFAATASHGLLDAFTNGGRGVAFWAPFSDARYHFPVTPIEVSPVSVRAFFTARGLEILANELVWIWVPALLLVLVAGRRRPPPSPGRGSPAAIRP